MAIFQIPFSHSQIAVFDPGLEHPFNDWDTVHVNQGFSWRPRSVSFKTLDESGTLEAEFLARKSWSADPKAERIIRVPFLVADEGIELASIISSHVVKVPPGPYSVYYEAGKEPVAWVRLTFVPDTNSSPAIIKADDALRPPEVLKMEAAPAL